jgi:hypothetical protein
MVDNPTFNIGVRDGARVRSAVFNGFVFEGWGGPRASVTYDDGDRATVAIVYIVRPPPAPDEVTYYGSVYAMIVCDTCGGCGSIPEVAHRQVAECPACRGFRLVRMDDMQRRDPVPLEMSVGRDRVSRR